MIHTEVMIIEYDLLKNNLEFDFVSLYAFLFLEYVIRTIQISLWWVAGNVNVYVISHTICRLIIITENTAVILSYTFGSHVVLYNIFGGIIRMCEQMSPLVCNVFKRVSHHVYNTTLLLRFRKCRRDCILDTS